MLEFDVPPTLLVIAQSARMLAQMAVDAGFAAVAIDCFADSDTRQLAQNTVKVASLALDNIRPALETLRKSYDLTHVVYGSGFERYTDTLVFLEENWIVLGNSAEVFRQFQDKQTFFNRLVALSIPHPETVFTPPTDQGPWLLKPQRGEGGAGISRYDKDAGILPNDSYWQRHLQGDALSVLFLAYRDKVEVLGVNRQWTAAIDCEHSFIFAGIANHAEVSATHRMLLFEWLTKLVAIYPLQGLGSLDFIVADGVCYVLEINARISASAQLYGESILKRHIQACLGIMDDTGASPALPAGYQIIYAKNSVKIGEAMDWPDWSVDRPESGAIIGKGQPICSIIAAGKSPELVAEQLRHRQRIIENSLNTGY